MNDLKVFRRVALLLIILIFCSQRLLAAGFDAHLNGDGASGMGYTHLGIADANKLPTTALVQVIIGSPSAPDPLATDFINGNDGSFVRQTFNIGYGDNGQDGKFDLSFHSDPSTGTGAVGNYFLRIWEESAPARGGHYRNISTPATAADNPMPNDINIPSFTTAMVADAPPPPNVVPGTPAYAKQVIGGKDTLVPYLSIYLGPGDSTTEVNSYHLIIREQATGNVIVDADNIGAGWSNDPADINQRYFKFSSVYTATATATNYFGTSALSDPPATFQTVDLGKQGGNDPYVLTLESSVATGGKGMNFISMPFPSPWYAVDASTGTAIPTGNNTNQIVNAYDLVKAINAAAGGTNIVSTFGTWGAGSQTDGGVLITNNNPDAVLQALTDIVLEQGKGYQVYCISAAGVNYPFSFKIKNSQ